MRCAIYVRVSDPRKGQDVENQRPVLEQFCKDQHWTLTKVYEDGESAGGKKVRPAYEQLFEDASRRKFDLMLFWSLDRFSREGVYKTLTRLEQLKSFGVGFKSYTELYLDSLGAFKDVVLAILAAVAKMERERLSDRVKAGLARVVREGGRIGRKPIEMDQDSLRKLRDSGHSIREIARILKVSRTVTHKHLKALALEDS